MSNQAQLYAAFSAHLSSDCTSLSPVTPPHNGLSGLHSSTPEHVTSEGASRGYGAPICAEATSSPVGRHHFEESTVSYGIGLSPLMMGQSAAHSVQSITDVCDSQPNMCQPAASTLNDYPEVACPKSRVFGRGLENLGNTCFLNSVLQCMAHAPPIYQWLQRHKAVCSADRVHPATCCVCCELATLFQSCFTKDAFGNALTPRNITALLPMISKRFRVGYQQDAHEFLVFLLDCMENHCKQRRLLPHVIAGAVTPSAMAVQEGLLRHAALPVAQMFKGSILSIVTCDICGQVSSTTDPSELLSLDIKGDSLEDCLRGFCAAEKLDHNNSYHCEKCQRKVTATRRIALQTLPEVLCVHFKRFRFDGMFSQKISTHIKYPMRLDVAPFVGGEIAKSTDCVFQLTGVVTHSGYSANSGHYYSMVRHAHSASCPSPPHACMTPSEWMEMNDSFVSTIPAIQVLKQEAYMLFYIRNSKDGLAGVSATTAPGHHCVPLVEVGLASTIPHRVPLALPLGLVGVGKGSVARRPPIPSINHAANYSLASPYAHSGPVRVFNSSKSSSTFDLYSASLLKKKPPTASEGVAITPAAVVPLSSVVRLHSATVASLMAVEAAVTKLAASLPNPARDNDLRKALLNLWTRGPEVESSAAPCTQELCHLVALYETDCLNDLMFALPSALNCGLGKIAPEDARNIIADLSQQRQRAQCLSGVGSKRPRDNNQLLDGRVEALEPRQPVPWSGLQRVPAEPSSPRRISGIGQFVQQLRTPQAIAPSNIALVDYSDDDSS